MVLVDYNTISVSSRAAHVKRRRNLSAESAETRLGHQNPRHDKGCNSRLVIDEDNDKSSVTSDDSEDDDIIAGKQPTKTKSKKLPLTVNDPLVGNKYSPKQKNVSNMPNHENRSSGGNRVNNKSLDKNGGSGKKGNGRSSWDCTICTFKNANNTFTCQMCDTRKGTSTRKPRLSTQTLAQQVSAAKSVNPITSALDSSGKVSSPSDLGKRVDFGAIDKSPRSPAIDKKTNEESKMGPNTSDAVIETSGGIVLPGCPSSQIKEKVKPKKVDRADNLVHKVGGQKEEKIIGKRKLSDNFHHSSPLIIPVTTADKSIKSPPTKKKDKKKPASTPDSALKPAQKNCKKVAVKTAPSPADINNNNLIINIDNNTTGKTKFPAKKRPKSEPNTNSIPIPKDDKNFAAATKKDKEPILSSTVNCDDFGGVGISNDNAASVKKRKGRKPGSCNKKKVAANSLLLLATSGHLMMGPNHSHNSSTSTDNICANPALRDDIFRSDNYCKEEPKIEEKSQSQHPQQSSKVGIVTPFIRNEHSTKSSTIHHSKKHRIISGQSAININKPPDLKVNNFDPQPGNNPHPNYFPTTPPVILDLGAYDENKAKSPHSFLAKLMMTSSANRDTSSHATLVSSPQVPIASNHFDRFINSWKKLVTKNEEIQRSSNGNNSDNSHCAIGDERSVDLTAGHASNHAKTLQHLKYLEDHDPKYPCVNNINLPYSPDSFAYPNKKTNNVVSVNRDRTRHTPAVVKGTTDFSPFSSFYNFYRPTFNVYNINLMSNNKQHNLHMNNAMRSFEDYFRNKPPFYYPPSFFPSSHLPSPYTPNFARNDNTSYATAVTSGTLAQNVRNDYFNERFLSTKQPHHYNYLNQFKSSTTPLFPPTFDNSMPLPLVESSSGKKICSRNYVDANCFKTGNCNETQLVGGHNSLVTGPLDLTSYRKSDIREGVYSKCSNNPDSYLYPFTANYQTSKSDLGNPLNITIPYPLEKNRTSSHFNVIPSNTTSGCSTPLLKTFTPKRPVKLSEYSFSDLPLRSNHPASINNSATKECNSSFDLNASSAGGKARKFYRRIRRIKRIPALSPSEKLESFSSIDSEDEMYINEIRKDLSKLWKYNKELKGPELEGFFKKNLRNMRRSTGELRGIRGESKGSLPLSGVGHQQLSKSNLEISRPIANDTDTNIVVETTETRDLIESTIKNNHGSLSVPTDNQINVSNKNSVDNDIITLNTVSSSVAIGLPVFSRCGHNKDGFDKDQIISASPEINCSASLVATSPSLDNVAVDIQSKDQQFVTPNFDPFCKSKSSRHYYKQLIDLNTAKTHEITVNNLTVLITDYAFT